MKKEKKFIELDDFKLEKLKGGLKEGKDIFRAKEGCGGDVDEGTCWDCVDGTSADTAGVSEICEELSQVDEGAP